VAVDSDARLTDLAAEILRDSIQVYGSAGLLGYNPVLAGWSSGMYGGLEMTSSLQALTGSFQALTGSFPTGTSAFLALSQESEADRVTLKRVFRLPRRLPGVRLPSAPELAKAARSAPLMTKLEALAGWLGREGRLVDAEDGLRAADAADAALRIGLRPDRLPYLWEYALVSGWFELIDEPDGHGQRSRAVHGQTARRWADGDVSGTLAVWAAVFAAVLASALNVSADQAPEASWRLRFEGQGVALAVMLFLSRGTGLTGTDASDIIRQGVIGDRPARRLGRAWDTWVSEFGDPADRLLSELVAMYAVILPRSRDGVVSLAPLAQWALREQFRLDNITVPVIEMSAQAAQLSVADLIGLAEGISDAEFNAAFTTWLHQRGPERAARDLLLYAGSASPRARLTAVNLVRRIGRPAGQAWFSAMQRPPLRGYARIALSMMAADLPESSLPLILNPDPDDLNGVATDLLALVDEADDVAPDPERIAELFAEVIPQGEEGWVFALMSRSSHPDVRRMLELVAAHHPDRNLAKDARKAARTAAKNKPPARRSHAKAGMGTVRR
jgi:hypothetical protein